MSIEMDYPEFEEKSFDPKKGGAVSSAELFSNNSSSNYSSIQYIATSNSSYSSSPPSGDFSQSLSHSSSRTSSSSPPFSWNSTVIVDPLQCNYNFQFSNAPNVSSLASISSNNTHHPPNKNKWDRPDDPRTNARISSSFPPANNINPPSMLNPRMHMESFVPEKVTDFKHVIYNLLVDNHNNPDKFTFVQPCCINEKGQRKIGFCFNEKENPDKKLPELYALHIRKARLDMEDSTSVFIQDLYKYYLRACVELLSKYFEKLDKYTYLYEDIHLFLPNGSLEEAEQRMKSMKTRSRKKRMKMAS